MRAYGGTHFQPTGTINNTVTPVSLAAAASGKLNYVENIDITNTHTVAQVVVIESFDGAAGRTNLWKHSIPAGGGMKSYFGNSPLQGIVGEAVRIYMPSAVAADLHYTVTGYAA